MGVSWNALAKFVGIKPNTLYGWRSKQRIPDINEAVALAKGLDVSVDYLATGRVLDTIDNPNIAKIVKYLRSLSDEDLIFAMGKMSEIQSSPLRPEQRHTERAG
jgi:transcriptional regulator with XRE-family HTH domain